MQVLSVLDSVIQGTGRTSFILSPATSLLNGVGLIKGNRGFLAFHWQLPAPIVQY